MFSIMTQNREKKTGEAVAETVFSWIFGIGIYVSGGPFVVFEIWKQTKKKFRNVESFENYEEFWKIISYNFQSRKQISTLKGVYDNR